MVKGNNLITRLSLMRFLFIALSFFCIQLSAQDLLGYKAILDGFPSNVSFIKNHPPSDRISFARITAKDIVLLKDLVDSLPQVRYLGLEFENQRQLDSLCRSLFLFPNLEAVVFKEFSFRIDTLEPAGTLHLDNEFYKQKQLRALAFEGNSKINLAAEIAKLNKLPRLNYLIFRAFPAQHIPKGLKDNSQLRGISFEYKPLMDPFEFPPQISEIAISSTSPSDRIDHILEILPNKKRIETLSLSSFKNKDTVTYFDRGFKSLKNLELYFNDIYDLGQFMCNFSSSAKLEKLSFISGSLKQISSGLFQFKELTELRITKTKSVLYFPAQLSRLKKLRVLDLSENAIDTLPYGLFRLSELTDLNLSGNQLTGLSNKIGTLKRLKTLELQSNKLHDVPAAIGNFHQLQQLNLQANPLDTLPPLGGLKKLKTLNLSFCNLVSLPEDIGALSSLKSFDASDNFLTALPESITKLSKLENLRVSTNLLQKLPDHIGVLTNLRELYVDINQLKKLPISIGSMDQLKILNISHNNITILPESLGELSNLTEFYAINDRPSHYNVYDYTRKILRKDNPKTDRQLASTALREFPSDLKNWSNIKIIRIFNNDFSSFDILKSLFTIPSKYYAVDLSSCNISNLPSSGWDRFLGKELRLASNNIQEVPRDMINSPLLAELNFRQNKLPKSPKNQNSHAEKRGGVLLYFQQIGLMDMDDLPHDNDMVHALADRSNQCFIYDQDYKTTVELADKAIEINPDLAKKRVSFGNLGEARFRLGDYRGAISDLTQAIQRDTVGPIRIMNVVVPAFDNRAQSYLAIQDTIAALQDYLTLSKRFRPESWTDVGALYQKMNADEKALEAFQKSIDYYFERIVNEKEGSVNRQLFQLCILEIYIISNQHEKAATYALSIGADMKTKDLIPIYLYLNSVIDITGNKKPNFNPSMVEGKVSRSWGYDLLRQWIDTTALSNLQKQAIRDLTFAIEKLR